MTFLTKVGDEIIEMQDDPNPFPESGVYPAYCVVLEPGTGVRRPMVEDGTYFDSAAADKVLLFFANLSHTQGRLAGQLWELTPEQVWLIRETFGWMRPDGLRKYRVIFVEMGRGNGKSQLGAGIAGYLLLADGEMNPEVVGVAATKPQARKYCFERLKAMINFNPSLGSLVDMYRYEIRRRESSKWGGSYEACSSDVTSNWGGAPHGVLFDEVHAQKNRELWDAMETAMGKRNQPMMWGFTTAGWDRTSICWELHERTQELAKGVIEDTEFFGIIWNAEEDEDWTDPEIWRKANPMIGHAFEESFIEAKCKKAQATPAFQNTFRTMYLSQWVGGETQLIDMASWDANDDQPLPPPAKRRAFGGLDLSSTMDLSAFTLACRNGDRIEFHVKMYAPKNGLIERERRDRLPYRDWVRDGWLTLTEGDTIDQDLIKRDILQSAVDWDLRDVSYDRWNASKLVRELDDEGITMVAMGQGYASMSSPTKALLQLIVDGNIMHGGNKALRAQVSYTSAKTDPSGNIKPDKSTSSARIDGVVSMIMALDGINRRGQDERRSAYEDWDEDDNADGLAEVEVVSYGKRSAYEEE